MKTIINKIFLPLTVTITLLMTGCIDLKQDIWINEDGSGKLVFDIGLTKQFKAMMDMGNAFEGLDLESEDGAEPEKTQTNPFGDPEKTIVELEQSEHVTSAHYKEKSDGKFERTIYTIELSDITKIGELMSSSSLGEGVNELGGEKDSSDELSVKKTESGTFVVTAVMEGDKEEGIDAGGDEFGMMQEMFKDAGMTIRVHAPAVSHNGKKKRGAIVWNMTLADLSAGKRLEVNGEFRGGKSSDNTFLMIGIFVLGAVIVLGIIVLSRK
ncbi:MAG: hypothetical protein MK172_13610, partial [Verrucomicrobiales bacterium]|nr:hypothetical protein [Verrucomicrobiales bacterium]